MTQGGAVLTITHSVAQGTLLLLFFFFLSFPCEVEQLKEKAQESHPSYPSSPPSPHLSVTPSPAPRPHLPESEIPAVVLPYPAHVRNGCAGKGNTEGRGGMVEMTAAGKSMESYRNKGRESGFVGPSLRAVNIHRQTLASKCSLGAFLRW